MKDLGFGNRLASIKPDDEPENDIPDRKLDEVAERHGFVAREPVQKITRRKEAEPSANLNIRPPISTHNRFVKWAIENRLSYPEALKELMDRAKID
ncbi:MULTISPECIES: hypothetical protein [Agrobacterium]|uniref:Uncharacterized protein n=1 Tax=Agrobacterium genomosp. 2 str. CFBP 5494 TaxID=1183436 RepID=A0A9W5F6F0_9HYPH|nr:MULTISPECIES: hypothetical protein [Agrobacterium]OJH51591.1 hypothetical protein ATN81_27935 [Agrobacterium pusense]CUX03694.1 conserved hypothetical protein [Agrobacterium genomosp. 2 str. CFBP 5494]